MACTFDPVKNFPTCSSCGNNSKLYKNSCYATCPNLTYEKTATNSCLDNPANCEVATKDTGTCTTAASGYYLDLSSLPTPCSSKISNCLICSAVSEDVTCSNCGNNTKLYQNSCEGTCPPLTYERTDINSCLDNPANCIAAEQDTGVCTTAASGYFLNS